MSDFIYSSVSKPEGELTKNIQSIYHYDPPVVNEYHGSWGSLAVSHNLYNGFQPFETPNYLFVVIGGPVFNFRDNLFLTGNDPVAGSRSIFERWQSGVIRWDEDLSGFFAVLVIDKTGRKIQVITDLMLFIPVYQYQEEGTLMLGTHVDALAKASQQSHRIDHVSLVDFVLNGVITFPHTMYKQIFQNQPASIHIFRLDDKAWSTDIFPYWQPLENNVYSNIDDAARELREGVEDYIDSVTEGMTGVAQFISAGEDSRTIAGMMPKRLDRDAYIFLDSMNREGKIARKVADAYDTRFCPSFRSQEHYLEIIAEASDLIGSGHQYIHAHTLGFHKTCGLDKYSAVFGGYRSDTLLKGMYAPKKKYWRRNIPFLPEVFDSKRVIILPLINKLFADSILENINHRRAMQMEKIAALRPDSASEWYVIWPITMGYSIPYIFVNRRLFSSYEPFTCSKTIKIAAAVPIKWKLNRRLFQKAFSSHLKPSRWIFHSTGRLPYFPWWTNIPVQTLIWCGRQIGYRTGIIKGNQGPWGDWGQIMGSRKWQNTIQSYANGFEEMRPFLRLKNIDELFNSQALSRTQKINLLQVLRFLA